MAEPLLPDALRVHPQDDVLVALRDLQPGETVRCASDVIVARAHVPRGHKIAAGAIAAGSLVRKYGWPIGRATSDISPGEHVHTHNLATMLAAHSDYTYTPPAPAALDFSVAQERLDRNGWDGGGRPPKYAVQGQVR